MGGDRVWGEAPCLHRRISRHHRISLRYSFEDPLAKMLATNDSTSAEQVSQ